MSKLCSKQQYRRWVQTKCTMKEKKIKCGKKDDEYSNWRRWIWKKMHLSNDEIMRLRTTPHKSQGPWPWNSEGLWLSSKGRTMGVGLPILCEDGFSNTVWSENGPCYILLVEKRGYSISLAIYLHCLIFHLFFFSFISVMKKKRAWWIILREKGGFLLRWLYIGVCTWLCSMGLIYKHWHSTKNGKNSLILSIWFKSTKTSDRSV